MVGFLFFSLAVKPVYADMPVVDFANSALQTLKMLKDWIFAQIN